MKDGRTEQGGGEMQFDRGQTVYWKPAPLQLAQVIEIRRTCVRLFYRCFTGRERQPIINAQKLADQQRAAAMLPLPFYNPMRRALMPWRGKGTHGIQR